MTDTMTSKEFKKEFLKRAELGFPYFILAMEDEKSFEEWLTLLNDWNNLCDENYHENVQGKE